MKKVYFILLTLTLANQAQAAEFCVSTSSDFQAALTTAANNAEHDHIKLVDGQYTTEGIEFSYVGTNSMNLEISGGWSEFFGNPCGQQLTGNLFGTRLDGDGSTRVLRIQTFGSADITLSNLTFINGFVGSSFYGGGLFIYNPLNSHTGKLVLERSAFIGNEANYGGALSMTSGSRAAVRNNLFISNHTTEDANVRIGQTNEDGVFFTNNMLMSNTNDNIDAAGLRISITGSSNALVANSILLDNDNFDLELAGTGDFYLHHNDMGAYDGAVPFSEYGNFNLPPRFESGLFNFTPASNSPLVDAGRQPCTICVVPVPFEHQWGTGVFDLIGSSRVLQDEIDIGAFESPHVSDLIFMHTFD